MVDNTFCPLIVSPIQQGADVVIHSLTKFMNGASDIIAGAICGSTEFIIQTVTQAPAGTIWGIGTELHLVNRLASEHPDQVVHFLSPMVCMCATMYRIDLPHLAWCLDHLSAGNPVNRIKVPGETAHWARVALERMLEVK